MSPPPFCDLGKQARDILTKGYPLGYMKYEFKCKGPEGVELTSVCVHSQEQCSMTGTIELKKKLKEYGLTLLGKWNTSNTIAAEIANQDHILQGLKLSADTCYSVSEGCKGSHVKGAYVNDRCALNGEFECGKEDSYSLTASAVLGIAEGILAGLQSKFNLQSSEMESYIIGGGYQTSDLILNAFYHNGQKMNISCYHKTMPELEVGLDLGYNLESSEPRIECGVKYALDGSSAVRAKVDVTNVNLNRIGVGYQQKIAQGVLFMVSAQLDVGGSEEGGGHKFGIAVELEA